jgi:parallel beta-helix repeat protein
MAINPYVPATATGNGVQVDFSFTFPYLNQLHVKASINGTLTTAFTFFSTNVLRFSVAPAAGAVVLIFRETPADALAAVIQPGGPIPVVGLNQNFLQGLYYTQEAPTLAYIDAQDALKVSKSGDTMSGVLAMGGNKITSLASPTADTDAASKIYVDNTYTGTPGFTQDGTGAVTRSWSSKLKDVVSVKDFGAVGDGVADDTAEIQAAVDSMSAGSSLYFPGGTYLVTGIQLSGTLQNKTGLSFVSESAVIKLANGITNKNTAEIVSGSDYLISGLTFKGNKGTVTTTGTDASYRYFNALYVGAVAGKTLSNVKIEYCSFDDAPYCGLMAGSGPVEPAAILPGVDSLSVNGCSFTGNEVGVAGGAQRSSTYTGNTFTDNDIYGILIDVASTSVSVTGNSIDNLSIAGGINSCLFAYNADYVSFTNNTCTGGKLGILLDSGSNFCTISGNTCFGQTTNSIRVVSSTHTTVSGNTVKNAGQAGIYLGVASTQCTVVGNVVADSGFDNIICDTISAISLVGNVLTGANGSGILFSSCTWVSASNNTCLNNNVNNGDSFSSGIRLNSTTASRITDNFCTDTQGVKTQNYGIREEGTANQNYYAGNYLAGNKTANRSLIGANNVFIGHPGSEAIVNVSGGSAAAPGLSFIASPTSGLYRSGTDDVGVTVAGNVSAVLRSVSGAVNYPVIRSGATDNIDIFSEGSSANINTNISCKGSTGSVVLRSGNSAAVVIATQGGLGFQGSAAIAKPTVTGSRGANAALASLLTALANYGLITDSTS